MLLPIRKSCQDSRQLLNTIKIKRRRFGNLTILVLTAWLLKCILPTICLAHGLNDLIDTKEYSSTTNWSRLHAQRFEHLATTTTNVKETVESLSICLKNQYAEENENVYICLDELVEYLNLSNESTIINERISDETKHVPFSMTSVVIHDDNGVGSSDVGGKGLRNFIEIIELFLCLLIASCIELLPVGWQQFRQWQQQRSFHSSSATAQQSTSQQNEHLNKLGTSNVCLKFSLWQWLLSKKRKCSNPVLNRKQQLSKAKKCLNAFLTVKMPLISIIQEEAFIKDIILQDYAFIIWNIIVHEMTKITTKESKPNLAYIMFYLMPEGVATAAMAATTGSYESLVKRHCSKERTSLTQNKKSYVSQACQCCSKNNETLIRNESLKCSNCYFHFKNVPASRSNYRVGIDVSIDAKSRHKSAEVCFCNTSTRKSVGVAGIAGRNTMAACCTYCCCCYNFENTNSKQSCKNNNCCYCYSFYNYCCCCSICCCYCKLCCDCTWCCCMCQYKKECCYCCSIPSCSWYKKATQSQVHVKWLFNRICGNSLVKYFQNFYQNIRAKACSYVQRLCTQNIQLYQRRQRQRRTTPTASSSIKQKKNFCIGHHGIANCTTNYQQLEASNICKFFCNNRKRQRRRRRKRRRRHQQVCTQNLACSCNNRLGQLIKTNKNYNNKNFFHMSLKCNQQRITISMLSSFTIYLKNAFKTIINICKRNQTQPQQQQYAHYLTKKLYLPITTTTTTTARFQPTTTTKARQNIQNLKRIHCRGFKSWPNLAWLFIGLVWFESSRLVDCDLQRQLPLSEEKITSEQDVDRNGLTIAQTTRSTNFFHECAHIFPSYKNTFNTQPKTVGQRKILKKMFASSRQISTTHGNSALIENNSEFSLQSDQIRLESIKNQILSKLGLSVRPNVSHPLPKQFIWDTISRIDELDNVIKSFDYTANVYTKTMERVNAGSWSFIDDHGRSSQIVQVRAQRNSTHAPHQSYSVYSEKQQQQQKPFNSISQQQKQQNDRNHINNNKLTYLSGITSDMKVSAALYEDEDYSRKNPTPSSRHELNNDAIVSELHHYKSNNDIDNDGQGFYGKTEEIISFAEAGELYSHHRLIEFRTRTMEVFSNEKLFVRSAEIHLRIDSVKNFKDRKKLKEDKRLKIWIFRMTETNSTKKGYEQQIIFCDAFEIDTRHLGWKKLDITDTVRDWFAIGGQSSRKRTERLRLLIDCTGCGDQYRLRLFKNDGKELQSNMHRTESNLKNDVVADWLQQQIENHSETTNEAFLKIPDREERHTYSNPDRPFLVIRTERHRSRRVRRRVVDCSGALRGQCCKESFYVSFKALGWDDWIIAPRGYFANYCRGECTGSFRTPDTFQTFHAHFIEEYRKMGLLNGMKPCCAPIKFSSMSLIYYGDDGIIKRDLPKMVVDECGCP